MGVIIITLILQIRKLRHREVKSPIQGQTANEWQSQDLKPGCLARVHTLNLYILMPLLKTEMEQAGREAAGRVFQAEGTASAKALRQEQT